MRNFSLLGHFVDITSSKRIKRADYVPSGVPFYRSKEVIELAKGGKISTKLFITEEQFSEIQTKFGVPKTGDILLTAVGTIGVSWKVDEDSSFYFKDGNLIWFKNFDSELDSTYLVYWLRSKVGQDALDRTSIGSTQRALTIKGLKSIPFKPPDLNNQKAIVRILGALDHKIEVNQKMSETLEEIAKAIFKSWFVDFDPVYAKAEGRPTGLSQEISDLFPDEFVDSEIGKIPKGWEVTYLKDQLSFALGGDWGKAEESTKTPNECRCIRGADIANLQRFIWSDMPVRYLKDASFEKRALQNWDLTFEISGGSPTQSTGRCVLVAEGVLDSYDSPITASNFCRLLRFRDSKSAVYHYQMFRGAYDRDEYFMYETGTTGIKNFGFKHYSENVGYVLPSAELLDCYFKTLEPMIEKSGFNMRENITLADLRDTLLPKLISGELRVPDAEKFLEEAGV